MGKPVRSAYTLLALLLALFLHPALGSEHSTVIRVGGDDSFPPYEFIDSEGNIAGYNVDMTRAIAEVMGVEVEIVLDSWSTMRRALEEGEVDVLQGMVATPEREQTYSFSAPSTILNYSFFGREGGPQADSLEDIEGRSVAVQYEGLIHDYLRQQDLDIEIVTMPAHSGALRQVASGQSDFALGATLPSLYFSQEHGLSNIRAVWRPIQPQPYGYAVMKGNEELLTLFSEGLAILRNTGKQQEIYDRWMSPLEGSPSDALRYVGLIIAAAVLITLVALGVGAIWIRTLQREVERRTREVREQQQQLIQADKMSSLGTLVSGVAHEINNPSGLILLNLPMLKDAWQDTLSHMDHYYQQRGSFQIAGLDYQRMRAEIPYVLDEMNEGAQRIKRIVNDLRDFARQEDSDTLEAIQLNEVVRTATRLLDVTIRSYTHNFRLNLHPTLPRMMGNAQRIEQVVINLILNACQALPDPDHGVRVETRVDSSNRKITLSVQDDGCGIPDDVLPQLTDPFFTTKREQGGTGLGLSVSAGIIKAYNGAIQFHSKPGKGTRVDVSFPVATPEA